MKELTIKYLPELPFAVEESINQLRINLGFCGDQIKTIMITSSIPDEGKSFIGMHLWKMLAAVGNRVLLIDCDLRASVLRAKYGIKAQEKITGIEHYLSGQVELGEALYKTNIENGFLLPAATTVANPSLLLESERFSAMIDQCAELFDCILIDTPPLESVADALQIAPHTDGIVLVVRSGVTSRKLVENAVGQIKRTGVPLLGMVLNRVEADNKNSYYYRRYYRYGYSRFGKNNSKTKANSMQGGN